MYRLNTKVATLIRIIIIAICSGIIITLTATAASHYLHAKSLEKNNMCDVKGAMHHVYIKQNVATPMATSAQLCDQLTIQNNDNVERLLSFGQHDHHVRYDGRTSETLKPGQALTITLVKTGTFRFHDHYDDAVYGTFTIIAK